MKYELWLASLKGLSHGKRRKLTEIYGSAKAVYNIEERQLHLCGFLNEKEIRALQTSKKAWDLEREYQVLVSEKVKLIAWGNEAYPENLKQIDNAPYALFVKGGLPEKEKFSVAIVGARCCSSYGAAMAREIAEELAKNKIEIISGMARGIDAIAARGALKGGGNSYALLGSGVDICYPSDNKGLYHDLQNNGGVISELPMKSAPLKAHFPARNRLISALADTIIIIEAKERSGSLITADMALEQGKEIYALPGPISSELSKGCNRLIQQGAEILLGVDELLQNIVLDYRYSTKKQEENKIKLESKEKLVYSCLDFYPINLGQIINKVNLPISEILNILVTLELKGYIEELSKNYYAKCR